MKVCKQRPLVTVGQGDFRYDWPRPICQNCGAPELAVDESEVALCEDCVEVRSDLMRIVYDARRQEGRDNGWRRGRE
jgi:hypothetical protein